MPIKSARTCAHCGHARDDKAAAWVKVFIGVLIVLGLLVLRFGVSGAVLGDALAAVVIGMFLIDKVLYRIGLP